MTIVTLLIDWKSYCFNGVLMHQRDHGHHSYNKAFAIGVFLNTAFIIVEVVLGLIAGSMDLIADDGHNLSDVVGLLVA